MRGQEVSSPTRDHRHIRLGLGMVIGRYRVLDAYGPPVTEGAAERLAGELDGDRMVCALRLRDDELTAYQFDRLVLVNEADLDQTVVLLSRPALRVEGVVHADVP